MAGEFTEGHYVLGIEGLALLRAGAARQLDRVHDRERELAEVVTGLASAPSRVLPESDPASGYAVWAASYDDPGNDTIALEEPAMRELLASLPAGPVLDAACGTGRWAAHLAAAGRTVIGVDASPAMLSVARSKLSGVDLREGSLEALPLGDGAVNGAVCALALSHLPRLGPPVAELARVLAPGGRLVISNPHPFATGVLGWRAAYIDDQGLRRMIPEYPHGIADYVRAFAAAGLVVRRCLEPALSAEQARSRAKDGREDAFEQALTGVPAVLAWEVERQGG